MTGPAAPVGTQTTAYPSPEKTDEDISGDLIVFDLFMWTSEIVKWHDKNDQSFEDVKNRFRLNIIWFWSSGSWARHQIPVHLSMLRIVASKPDITNGPIEGRTSHIHPLEPPGRFFFRSVTAHIFPLLSFVNHCAKKNSSAGQFCCPFGVSVYSDITSWGHWGTKEVHLGTAGGQLVWLNRGMLQPWIYFTSRKNTKLAKWVCLVDRLRVKMKLKV